MKKLPKQLHKYFWDTDPLTIDVVNKSVYVINRILQWVRIDDLRWLREEYGIEALKEVVRKSRDLPVKHANFFSLIYGIRKEEVRCLQPGFRLQHRNVWKH